MRYINSLPLLLDEPGGGRIGSHGNTLAIAAGRLEGRTPDFRSKPKRGINGIKQAYLYQNGKNIMQIGFSYRTKDARKFSI